MHKHIYEIVQIKFYRKLESVYNDKNYFEKLFETKKEVAVVKETGKKDKSATGGVMMAKGGYVSQLFKNASRTFGAGQDTINAILARGEAVIRRSSTAILGKTFVDHVNNGRMQQAYETMGNRMSSMYNNRYDNRSFNNQANITQNFYGSSSDGNNYLKSYIKGV